MASSFSSRAGTCPGSAGMESTVAVRAPCPTWVYLPVIAGVLCPMMAIAAAWDTPPSRSRVTALCHSEWKPNFADLRAPGSPSSA